MGSYSITHPFFLCINCHSTFRYRSL